MRKKKDKEKLEQVPQLAREVETAIRTNYAAACRHVDAIMDVKRHWGYFLYTPDEFLFYAIKPDDFVSALKNVGVPDADYVIQDHIFHINNNKSLRMTENIDNGFEPYPIVLTYNVYYKNIHIAKYEETDSPEYFSYKGTIFTLPVPNENELLKENWLTENMVMQICKDFAGIPGIKFWGQSKNKDDLDLVDELKKTYISLKQKQEKIDNYMSGDKNIKRRLYQVINDIIHDSKYQHRYFHEENYYKKYDTKGVHQTLGL